jgi:hypothetical protein
MAYVLIPAAHSTHRLGGQGTHNELAKGWLAHITEIRLIAFSTTTRKSTKARAAKNPMQRSRISCATGIRGMHQFRRLTTFLAGLACFIMLAQPVVVANCPMHARRVVGATTPPECSCRQDVCCQGHNSSPRLSDVSSVSQQSFTCGTAPAKSGDVPVCSCQRPIEHALPVSHLRPISVAFAFSLLAEMTPRLADCDLLRESLVSPAYAPSSGRCCFLSCRIQV